MTKTTCNECKGTGQLPAFDGDWEARRDAGETDDCPWCGATGEVEVVYAVRVHGHNGDHSFSELWDVKPSLDNAKKLARKIMEKERFRNLHNGVPTIGWVEITGPGIPESISLEEHDGKLTWQGEENRAATHAGRDELITEALGVAPGETLKIDLDGDPEHSQSAKDAEARGDVDPAEADERPVRLVYDFIFDTFATDVPEIVTGTGLTEGRVRTALQKLTAAGLVDSYDVNDEAQGSRRRGQYKTLTYQCLETYDSLTKDEATAKFLAEFPITPKAPKGAERSDTMSQSTIITPEALVDGSESPLDVESPGKAPYHRVRANGKTLAYATQRSDGFTLELYSAGLKAAEKLPARFKKMLDAKNRVRVTPKNEKGARSMMEWLAGKVG